MTRATLVSLLMIALLVAGGPADAKTYRWVDKNGVVTYSDRPPQVAPVEGERDALIDEAIEISGLGKALAGVQDYVKASVDLSNPPFGPKDRAVFLKILLDAYRPAVMLEAIRSALRSNYDPLQMGLHVAQLRAPLSRKMTALEIEASTPEARKEVLAFADRLKSAPPTPARVALLVRLDTAVAITDSILELKVASLRAVFRVLAPMLPPDKRPSPAAVEQVTAGLLERQTGVTRQGVLVWFLYTYRSATDEELEQYVLYEESAPSLWFRALVRRATLEAVTTATETAIRQVAKAFPPKR